MEEKGVEGANGHGYHEGCECSVCACRRQEKLMLQQYNDKLIRMLQERDDSFRELCLKYKTLKKCKEIWSK